MSIRWEPRANFLLNRLNKENTLLNLLSMSTIGFLIISLWFGVSASNDNRWEVLLTDGFNSSSNLKMWLWDREWALSFDLPLSF